MKSTQTSYIVSFCDWADLKNEIWSLIVRSLHLVAKDYAKVNNDQMDKWPVDRCLPIVILSPEFRIVSVVLRRVLRVDH